ncbi:hypothetical protein WDD9_006574 [Paenibacillus melissococcoides]|uniref:hypothetical protein n=1 Tax=Paenibacillus melissococcoides TaxID=2912268 RepID=UPI0021C31C25|nr:hypothetical protein [Paenibacillus melissococcoides]CAH8722007.1 hypothetical protein WDD9_006574 [Paenibacillus melissococcoides]
MNQSFGSMTKTGLLMAGVGMQISDSVLKPVEATFDTRRALGELASLGTENLGLLEQAARDFSDQWGWHNKIRLFDGSVLNQIRIASLTDEGVAEYTRLAGLTGKSD